MGGSGIGSTPSMDPVERMVGEEGGKQDQEQESGIKYHFALVYCLSSCSIDIWNEETVE